MRTRIYRQSVTATLLSVAMLWTVGASAQVTEPETAALCDRAARAASQSESVPYDILLAITRTETGRGRDGTLLPWPWTANAGGQGDWFESREAALHHVEAILASGRRNVDIGCFQLNHRWHADAFATLRQMFDPEANARYAAQFLRRLYAELGDWDAAVGAYHSRTPTFAARYMARFRTILAGLPGTPAPDQGRPRAPATGPSPLDVAARPSLLTRAGGLSTQGAAPLLSARPAQSLFGDLP